MKGRILKAISTMLVICLSTVMLMPSPSLASQKVNNSTSFIKDGLLYEEKFEDSEKNNIILKVEKYNKELEVKTYVNNHQLDSAKRKILADGTLDENIQYVKYSQKGDDLQTNNVQTFKAKDFLDMSESNLNSGLNVNNELLDDSRSVLSEQPSYPYIKGEYSSAWGYWGYLYGENTNTSSKEKSFYFDPYTSISIIVSVLVGAGVSFFTGFTVYALASALGTSIVSGVITSVLTGKASQTIKRWDYEVFVELTKSLVGRIDYITTKTYNSGGYLTGTYSDVQANGPYKNESEIIQYGIYSYAI
ncbi:hypothetical protein [Desulfosporosinus fructosivorans]